MKENRIIIKPALKTMNLASTRARGRKGGRPTLPKKDIELALKMYDSKEYSISEIEKKNIILKFYFQDIIVTQCNKIVRGLCNLRTILSTV